MLVTKLLAVAQVGGSLVLYILLGLSVLSIGGGGFAVHPARMRLC